MVSSCTTPPAGSGWRPARATSIPIVSWTTGTLENGSADPALAAADEDFAGAGEYLPVITGSADPALAAGPEAFAGTREYVSVMTGTRRRTDLPGLAGAPAPENADAPGTTGGAVILGTFNDGNQTPGVLTEGSGAT